MSYVETIRRCSRPVRRPRPTIQRRCLRDTESNVIPLKAFSWLKPFNEKPPLWVLVVYGAVIWIALNAIAKVF